MRFSAGDCKCNERNVFNVVWSDVVISFGEEEDNDEEDDLSTLL